MIFVTTGTQFSFDRLLLLVQKWAEVNKDVKVVAQTCSSNTHFKFMETKDFLNPSEYNLLVSSATVIVGHAGMGTIITAHEFNLPVIIMPRRLAFNEHRNDHQMATVSKFRGTKGIHIAEDEQTLFTLLDKSNQLEACGNSIPHSRAALTQYLSEQINL